MGGEFKQGKSLPVILIQDLQLMEKTCQDFILEIACELDKGQENINIINTSPLLPPYIGSPLSDEGISSFLVSLYTKMIEKHIISCFGKLYPC